MLIFRRTTVHCLQAAWNIRNKNLDLIVYIFLYIFDLRGKDHRTYNWGKKKTDQMVEYCFSWFTRRHQEKKKHKIFSNVRFKPVHVFLHILWGEKVHRVQGGSHGQILLRACIEYISDSEPVKLGSLDNFVFHNHIKYELKHFFQLIFDHNYLYLYV